MPLLTLTFVLGSGYDRVPFPLFGPEPAEDLPVLPPPLSARPNGKGQVVTPDLTSFQRATETPVTQELA